MHRTLVANLVCVHYVRAAITAAAAVAAYRK